MLFETNFVFMLFALVILYLIANLMKICQFFQFLSFVNITRNHTALLSHEITQSHTALLSHETTQNHTALLFKRKYMYIRNLIATVSQPQCLKQGCKKVNTVFIVLSQ